MSVKLVNDDSLTDVADAIRIKGEISGTLEFPDGFIGAIQAIPTGGITPSGTMSITSNGTYDVTQYASADVNVSGGGGASNVVTGTFTTDSADGAHTFTIPYTGSGYPIYFALWIDGGMYNNTAQGNTDWYNLKKVYAVGLFSASKQRTTTAPTYTSSGVDNNAVVTCVYKNSSSSSTSYTRGYGLSNNSFSNNDAVATSQECVKFKGNGTTLSYYNGSTSFGLVADTKYAYVVVYSS